ncbi:MAG: VOC family protein [Gemmatimonadales bacterium]|nr:VOC family protein [Gemmatimonadales bacterium]
MGSEHDRRIDYIEFGTEDLAASKRFFETAFGWKFTDYGPDYTAFEDGRLSGGINGSSPPGGAPLVILFASDLEEVERAVVAAGGVISDRHTFPGGRRFHFTEPGGNHLAVWSDH